MRRLLPVRNRLLRAVGRGVDLRDASVETTELHPEEVEAVRPAVFLDGQLERATGAVSGHGTLAGELALATRIRAPHAPVVRYTLENCLVHYGGVDYQGGALRKHAIRTRPLLSERIHHRRRAVYCMSAVSHQYFGHWLQDACATALLRDPDEALFLDLREDWPHAREYAAAFGFAPEPAGLHFVERLSVYEDHGQGAHKRRRYAELRRRLAAAMGEAADAGAKLYFRRGDTGVARLVANDDEVTRALTADGFETFDVAGASAGDIWRRFSRARVVVSMDGSHLNHLYFAMPPDSLLLTFIPADHFTMTQTGYAAAARLRYAFLVVDPTPGGYAVPIPDLLRTLARADAA